MMKELGKYFAAIHARRGLNRSEIQAAVESLTAEGMWDDDFLDILDPRGSDTAELLECLLRALRALDIELPSGEDAVWWIIDYHTRQISRGKVDPLKGLIQLMADVYWDYDFHSVTKHYLGDSHGIEGLFGLYWGWDDMMERPEAITLNGKLGAEAVDELKLLIQADATRWQEWHLANKR